MITDPSSPMLQQCTRYMDYTLVHGDNDGGHGTIAFESAKPYHQWPWHKLSKEKQKAAKQTLKLDKKKWEDWTKLDIARRKFKDLLHEQQGCVSEIFE